MVDSKSASPSLSAAGVVILRALEGRQKACMCNLNRKSTSQARQLVHCSCGWPAPLPAYGKCYDWTEGWSTSRVVTLRRGRARVADLSAA